MPTEKAAKPLDNVQKLVELMDQLVHERKEINSKIEEVERELAATLAKLDIMECVNVNYSRLKRLMRWN